MKRLNWLFTLTSASVLVVTVERYSFTTTVLLQPYSFLRLHELVQMCLIILTTVLIPTFLLREVTDTFTTVKSGRGFWLFLTFISGIYFYATGNGVHEVASFTFNQYCDTQTIAGDLCGGLFFNDYYTGNILYFVGAFLMNAALILLAKMRPVENGTRKEMAILTVNALVYALAIFAYAAFDRVLVGFIFTLLMSLFSLLVLWTVRAQYRRYPVITYMTITYLVGLVGSLLIRFR